MSKSRGLLLAGVLSVAMLLSAVPAAAQNYMGDYAWLRFWDATATWSDFYHSGPQRISWLGDLGTTGDRWYQLEWKEAMTLTGTKVETWQQFGPAGTIGEYRLQYWDDSAKDWLFIQTSVPLMGGVDYNGSTPEKTVSFLTPVTTTKIRVLFPEGSYNADADNKVGPGGGPGIAKLLPIGNLASGQGLDPADPKFNILATDWRGNLDSFLGIKPVVTTTGRDLSQGSGAMMIDNSLGLDSGERSGWLGPITGQEAIICDFGKDVSLWVHGVTLYGGTFSGAYVYLPLTLDVYVTDDLKDWGKPVAVAEFDHSLFILTTSEINAVGRYVILAGAPTNTPHFLVHEIAINARFPIPEPATMSLLALGGLALLRRRT